MINALPQTVKRMPLNIAGSSKFGRYDKISAESTYNMFLTDGWLVPTPGYLKVQEVSPDAEGRGIYSSERGDFLLFVIGNGVYRIGNEMRKIGREIAITDASERLAVKIGELDTAQNPVSIAENNAKQIVISDESYLYLYDYDALTFTKIPTDFIPGFITFVDGYIIAADRERNQWRLSDVNDATTFPATANRVGEFETKSNNVKAVVSIPGKTGHVFVIGSTVTESWNDVGYKLFPFFRTTSFNIDYGCVNAATIAASDKFIVWLGSNEKSGPVIMASAGGEPKQISTDGINVEFARLTTPEDSYGFLYKNDGHLFYQLTFPTDNVSYLYDFNTNKFYYLTDHKMDYHIARSVAFFNHDYYFVSQRDGNVYRIAEEYTTYDGETIPRIRIANTIRLGDGSAFVGRQLGFVIEQGANSTISRIDTTLSYDGGVTFGNSFGKELNPIAQRKNKFTVRQLGYANELTPQFRFWGEGRFVAADGFVEIYK